MVENPAGVKAKLTLEDVAGQREALGYSERKRRFSSGEL